MKYNTEYRWFQWSYMAFYFAFASLSTYMIPFLKSIGYNAIQRGIMFAAMALATIILQILTGYLCDKLHIIKKAYLLLSGLLIVAAYICYTFTKHQFWFHLTTISLCGGLYKLNYNLLDSWSLLACESAARKFGNMRAFGATGFALGTYVTSQLISENDYSIITWLVLLATLAGMALISRVPESRKEKGWADLKMADFKALANTRSYVVLIVIFLFINVVGSADQYTTIDKMMALEATKTQLGWKWAIQSLCEIPVFLLSLRLLQRLGGYQMMLWGTIFYVIKFLLYGYVNTVNGMLFVTAMQTITYPLITLSSRTLFVLVAKHHPELKTSTQLIASSITLGISALVAPLVSGILVSWLGHDITLYLLACLLIPVLWYAIKNRKVILTI